MLSLFVLTIIFNAAFCQQRAENLIIITTDGLRWQEVFNGMDKAIASNPQFNQKDSAFLFKSYWKEDYKERRKLLMPFLWNAIEKNGQIYGNRNRGNKVDNSNPYWFSYPGYSEIFTGYPDTAINSNGYKPNPNETVLEFINKQPGFKGKVAAFGAWDAFDRILNEKRAKFPVISAFDSVEGDNLTEQQKLVNAMLGDSYKVFGEIECQDVFTHYGALEYLNANRPKVLYIAYGETDEWAHAGQYKDYLGAAHKVDKWINDLWNFVQNDPQYSGKTAFFITTDHGRGDANKSEWTSHGNSVKDSHEIWFAAFGAGITPKGEIVDNAQIYQKQFAQTFATLLGLEFTADHPIAEKIDELLNN